MELTPREKDKLMLYTAGLVAERRLARGLQLNYPEAVALISLEILEGARDGRSVAELMQLGRTVITRDQVMEELLTWSTKCKLRRPSPMAPNSSPSMNPFRRSCSHDSRRSARSAR